MIEVSGARLEQLEEENARLRARVAALEGESRTSLIEEIAPHLPSNIMVLDREERIRYINWTVPDLSVARVLGTQPYLYVPESHRDTLRACFRGVFATGEPARVETSHVAEDGTVCTWEASVVPLGHASAIEGVVVVSTNVTERDAAAVDRDRFFSLSLDLLCVASFKGYLVRINPAFTRTLGFSEAELTSRPFLDFVHAEDREATVQVMTRLGTGAEVLGFENRYRCLDGSYRTLQWSGKAIPESGLMYAVARDVTEHNALEAQLRQAQKLDAVGQLAGGIAHDFNNLLLAIGLNLDIAERAAQDARVREPLVQAGKVIERAAEVVKQLLTFARNQPARFACVDLHKTVHHMLKILSRTLPESIMLEHVTAGEPLYIRADAVQIEQLLLNLCLNARDALDGRGTIRVVTARPPVASGEREPPVRLSVIDDGEGMLPSVRERVFEPFFTTKQPGRGTGLGLPVVYGVVKRHDAAIAIESEPGKGTSVHVDFSTVEAPAAIEVSAEHSEDVPAGSGETILIAEDSPTVQRALAQVLEENGYRVLTAASGDEAVARVRDDDNGRITLALLDVVMPGQSGPEAAAAIRALRPDITIVFASGYSEASTLGSIDGRVVMSKPYHASVLLRRIRDELSAR